MSECSCDPCRRFRAPALAPSRVCGSELQAPTETKAQVAPRSRPAEAATVATSEARPLGEDRRFAAPFDSPAPGTLGSVAAWHQKGARAPSARRDRFDERLACESPAFERRWRARENESASWPTRESWLGCQLGRGGSLIDGTRCAIGRSLPGVSLAFALTAAITGSTGSSATLSHGL
jgi:hypothetical protein